uniref:Pleckstrin homology domain-containing family F member 2 n=1 Tax=Enterobius vermicularis TaxID=51028 RepID=A0A0N4USG7_ENTVE
LFRKKRKPRQFFLFNDILIYGNILISKKRYNKQHIIPLEEVQLEDLRDDGDLKNGWLIKTRTKSFAVYAATATEKKEWMLHIERCVSDILTKGGKKPATEHAAVWTPDNDAPICMACQKTQFSVLQRRHHCRACGNVVCAACSSHTHHVSGVSKRSVRVCDRCFLKLTEKSSANAESNVIGRTGLNESSESDEEDKNAQFDHQVYFCRIPTFYNSSNIGKLVDGPTADLNHSAGSPPRLWQT